MALGSIARTAAALTSNKDFFNVIAFTNRKIKVNELSLVGNGATSANAAYQEVAAIIETGAAVGAQTSLTANKWEADSATLTTTSGFGAATSDPTIGALTTAYVLLGCNAYGGIYRWTARPNGEIVSRNVAASSLGAAGGLSLRQSQGTGTVSMHAVFDEL